MIYGGPFYHAKVITDTIRTDRYRCASVTENSFVKKGAVQQLMQLGLSFSTAI
jgi:hypothetical protein